MSDQVCGWDKFVDRVNGEPNPSPLMQGMVDQLNKWIDEYTKRHGEKPTYAEIGYWFGRTGAALMEVMENDGGHHAAKSFTEGYEIGFTKGYELRNANRAERATKEA